MLIVSVFLLALATGSAFKEGFPDNGAFPEDQIVTSFQDIRRRMNYPHAEQHHLLKRAQLGFHINTGHKTFLEDEYYKRAPMGFQGMRGKKSVEQIFDSIEKRTGMGFQSMRGKREHFNYSKDNGKRALAVGFHGMRGKKDKFLMEWKKRASKGRQQTQETDTNEVNGLNVGTTLGFHVLENASKNRNSICRQKYPLLN